MRLDLDLATIGLVKSRSQAAECIKKGLVSVDGSTSVKASLDVDDSNFIELLGTPHSFVGRGGMKLDYALDHFGINVTGMRAVDIGASTGGFTDCLLKRGAVFSLAVDSGHDQLDKTLLFDPRIKSLEGFNARNLTPDIVGYEADIVVADVSFISQTLIVPPAYTILKDGGIYIGLIKPQFECGISAISKNGIVKDKKQHRLAVSKVYICGKEQGFSFCGICPSPIEGGDGNKEFLIYMKKSSDGLSEEKFISMADEVCL